MGHSPAIRISPLALHQVRLTLCGAIQGTSKALTGVMGGPPGNCFEGKTSERLRDWIHVRVQSKRGGVSGEIAVLGKHDPNCSSSSACGPNCLFPISVPLNAGNRVQQSLPSIMPSGHLSLSFCLDMDFGTFFSTGEQRCSISN